jgi:hypothetical protein
MRAGGGSVRASGSDGLDTLARSVAQAGATFAEIFGKINAQRDETQARDAIARWDIAEAQARMRVIQADPSDPTASVPEPQDAFAQYQKEMETVTTGARKGMRAGAQRLFDDYLGKVTAKRVLETQSAIAKRAAIAEGAALERLGDTYAGMALNPRDSQEADYYINSYSDALASGVKRGVIDEDRKLKLEREFRQRISVGRIDILLKTAEGRQRFAGMDEEGAFASMDPATLQTKREAARSGDERDRRAALETETRMEKANAERYETERKAAIIDLTARALARELSLAELEVRREMRLFKSPEEYVAVREHIVNPKDAPSDADVLTNVSVRVHRVVPTITEDELDRAHRDFRDGKPGLNFKDWKEAKDKLVSRVDHARSEAQSEDRARHSQGEQIIDRALGISTPFDTLDKEHQHWQSSALQELTARSRVYNGQEDPLAVAEEIADRLSGTRRRAAQLKAPKLRELLRYETREALENAYRSGEASRASYLFELRKFHTLDALTVEQPTLHPVTTPKANTEGAPPLRRPGQNRSR